MKKPKFLKNPTRFSNRQLLVFAVFFAAIGGYFLWRSFALGPLVAKLEAEQMTLPAGASVINDTSASAGQAVKLTQSGTLNGSVTATTAISSLSVVVHGEKCQGWPKFNLLVDNQQVLAGISTSGSTWRAFNISSNLASGTHKIGVNYYNGATSTRCTKNLYVDVVQFYGPDQVSTSPSLIFSASPTAVSAGSSSTLTWKSTNTSSCSASGSWSGLQPVSGSASTGALNKTSTYTLACTGSTGSISASTTVTVSSTSPPPPPPSSSGFCVTCIQIRVSRPVVVRGPIDDELDNFFNEIQLSDGSHRGFSANGPTYAVSGPNPWDMGGSRTQVLPRGAAGSFSECGQWINSTDKVGGTVYGFFHAENACNINIGQTNKSMGLATSTNDGMSWNVVGQIIKGSDSPTYGKTTGVGDCTVVDGKDGYYYAYCLRASDWRTVVARAPTSSPGPGHWNYYYSGGWSQPALGGNATSIGPDGQGSGRWTNNGSIMLLHPDKYSGGIQTLFSTDKVNFTALSEPMLIMDDDNWNRPASTELMAYASVMNYGDAKNQFTSPFLLTYMYLQPNESFDKRYLVFRDVTITMQSATVHPQVGVALARWFNSGSKDRWSTTAPVPGNYSSYAYEGTFGYLMTKPDSSKASVKITDCVSFWPGHPDHLLSNGCDSGYAQLRTAGYAYQSSQSGTIPLYRCYNSSLQSHFASNQSNCDGLGTMERLLGYVLAS